MFTKTVGKYVICISRNIFKNELKRHLSVLNSEFMLPRVQIRNPQPMKWMKLQKCSNNSRSLSTVNPNVAIPPALMLVSREESQEFESFFPEIVCDLTSDTDALALNEQFARALEYNVSNGKKYRGFLVVAAYKMIESPEHLTPENIHLANILGWCVEMLHSSLLIEYDIMDREEIRRGLPCWYKNADVGLIAIHNACMIKSRLFSILKKYFSGHPCYVPTLDLLNEAVMETAMGRSLNAMSFENGQLNLSSFTMNRYNAIVKYKTACYSFQLPVALAMYLSGKYDPEMHRQAKTILLEMGHFFQMQDDYLDCFGDPEITGKVGTDIRKGKCSWLVVVALQRASPAQRKILEDHYGKPNLESEAAVRNLYEELDLPNTYLTYREESLNLIHTHIQQLPKGELDKLFFKFIDKV